MSVSKPSTRCCGNPLYVFLDNLANRYLWKDEKEDTPEKPVFSRTERWNIAMYILGIICYKFALESYLGTIRSLAVDRFTEQGLPVFLYQGYLEGFYSASQCVGTIIVGPLIKYFPVKSVLAFSLFAISIISMVIMAMEHVGGGTFPTECISKDGLPPKCKKGKSGDFDARNILVVVVAAGIPYGMIEIIRRIIPQNIVGGNENKLKKMDALVHSYNELSGTCGAFFSAYVSLLLGKAYGQAISPPLFMIAFIFFALIDPPQNIQLLSLGEGACGRLTGLMIAFKDAVLGFFDSVYQGGKILFFEPKFQWLFFGYTVPLVMHRYIEGSVVPIYAKLVLKESAYSSFMNAGSNAGELIGALFVLFNLTLFYTPLPTLRWDAMMLNLTWLFYNVITPESLNMDVGNTAGVMAAIMCIISMGWSAGDVSTAAFIQRYIPFITTPGIDRSRALASVMSFLYVANIIIIAVISPAIGNWVDSLVINQTLAKKYEKSNPALSAYHKAQSKARNELETQKQQYFYWIAGVFFSLVSVTIFANTFIPKGSWSLNPRFDDLVEETRLVELEDKEAHLAATDPDYVPATHNPSPRQSK